LDNDYIERQKKLEADSVHDGALRWAKSYPYHQATDTQPIRYLLEHSQKALSDAIRAQQLEFKSPGRKKLPAIG
jgi:hypothetical protein